MRIDEDTATAGRTVPGRPSLEGAAREFPGCRPMTITREDIATYDGRIEFWDADTETAWMVREPTGAAHEQPSQRLAGLGQLIAAVRGSPIECFGTMDLLLRNERGERWRIMQADQSVYLRPGRDRLPDPAGMVVGEHDFPDVVVEVDHTTDVRRGKLQFYEEWGFPEVWVEVPEHRSPSRPSGRLPGLTIHLLDGGQLSDGHGEPGVSGLDGGGDPHRHERVGAVGGDQRNPHPGGPGARRAGRHRTGRHALATRPARGRAAPWAGRKGGPHSWKRSCTGFWPRGESLGPGPRLDDDDLTGATDEEIIDALLQCEDESDFRARLQSLRRRSG